MFIDRTESLIKEVHDNLLLVGDKYDVNSLIRLCDSGDIVFTNSPEAKNGQLKISEMKFFVRTDVGNFVAVHKNGSALFTCEPLKVPDGVTLNDYMLTCLRVFLTNEFMPDCKPEVIALSTMPTPFGAILRENGEIEVLFQLVHRKASGIPISDKYKFVPVEEIRDSEDFKKIYKQFVITKEEK